MGFHKVSDASWHHFFSISHDIHRGFRTLLQTDREYWLGLPYLQAELRCDMRPCQECMIEGCVISRWKFFWLVISRLQGVPSGLKPRFIQIIWVAASHPNLGIRPDRTHCTIWDPPQPACPEVFAYWNAFDTDSLRFWDVQFTDRHCIIPVLLVNGNFCTALPLFLRLAHMMIIVRAGPEH